MALKDLERCVVCKLEATNPVQRQQQALLMFNCGHCFHGNCLPKESRECTLCARQILEMPAKAEPGKRRGQPTLLAREENEVKAQVERAQ